MTEFTYDLVQFLFFFWGLITSFLNLPLLDIDHLMHGDHSLFKNL